MAPSCSALNLSDESKCTEEATSSDGLFCQFHSKQCYGLYRGYKIRNARLNALDAKPPKYLADSKQALRNETFADVNDESQLNELHVYLFKKHALLDRVIRARKLHHSRFYSLSLDYGHKAYLDKLTNDKFNVVRALERLERRTAEVLYAQQKWFKWVRQCQDEEESAREKESEMIKKEAKLFKRRWKEVEARMREMKRRKDVKRQEAFLDEAYQERLKQMSEEEEEQSWDPIEDAVEDERQNFVDMMKRLLWLRQTENEVHEEKAVPSGNAVPTKDDKKPKAVANDKPNGEAGKNWNKNAKKRAKAKAKETAIEETEAIKAEVNETRSEMYKRLNEGVEYEIGEGISGSILAGTIENPHETTGKVPGIPSEEVEKLLDEVAQIKLFLFCRLLLSQAALLPTALKAETVEDFLSNPDVTTNELRDLCLKVEQPSLQEIRDACADFFRGDEETSLGKRGDEDGLDEVDDDLDESKLPYRRTKKDIPLKWRSKHEEEVDARNGAMQALGDQTETLVDFGEIGEIENGTFKSKKIRVKVCGKNIWNYPSEGSMARGGWLHYSIIARGSKLADAIELCRNWAEFWELNVLTIFRYFPSPRWEQWSGNRYQQQLLQFGFIPYLWFDQAQQFTAKKQAGGHGQGPKVHAATEYKNIVAGHIRRNDPVSRRLVQYLAMQAGHIEILVRDAKTGRILVEPEEEHRWLSRSKGGYGRAARSEWTVHKSVGQDMFEQVSGKKFRDWQFGFTDFYDIIVWDSFPGKHFGNLYSRLQEMLIKAYRFCIGMDLYNPMAPILKTLAQDRATFRTRDVRPGEMSIYDDIHHDKSRFVFIPVKQSGVEASTEIVPANFFYSDVDAAEDAILFPEEVQGERATAILNQQDPIFKKLDRAGPNSKRFILGLDSDDGSDDYEDIDDAKEQKLTDGEGLRGLKDKSAGSVDATRDLAVRNGEENGASKALEPTCTCSKCMIGEYELCEAWEDEASDDEDVLFDTDDGDPETMLIAIGFEKIEPEVCHGEDPETDFFQHLDREKAKIFKKCWYDSIVDGTERAQYQASGALIQKLTGKGKMSKKDRTFGLKLLLWLKVHFEEHRLVWRDTERAFAMMSLFFSSDYKMDANESELTQMARERLMDNASRAQKDPYNRTFRSNGAVPSDFWKEADEFYAAKRRASAKERIEYDRESDKFIRPIVAHWFKAGVIGPSHYLYAPGEAVRLSEPNKHPNVYIDYRRTKISWPERNNGMKDITDPFGIDLLRHAQRFANNNAKARFALLRVWTHSHFYPLMLGFENREFNAFTDEIDRRWQWKFVPRDMAGSEWSMQKSVDIRVSRFKKQFGKQVVTKRDMLLVMGKDEEELKRFAIAVTFAVQTNPWRLDIDLWKSFVNVDLAFLEGLAEAWLE